MVRNKELVRPRLDSTPSHNIQDLRREMKDMNDQLRLAKGSLFSFSQNFFFITRYHELLINKKGITEIYQAMQLEKRSLEYSLTTSLNYQLYKQT